MAQALVSQAHAFEGFEDRLSGLSQATPRGARAFERPTLLTPSDRRLPAQMLIPTNTSIAPRPKSAWERLHIRTFSEAQSPAFVGNPLSVPGLDGSASGPANMANQVAFSYELSKDWSLRAAEAFTVALTQNVKAPGSPAIAFGSPRIGVRRSNVFSLKNLKSDFDFYARPGVTPVAMGRNQAADVGFQMSYGYEIPRSRWSLSMIIDSRAGVFYGEGNSSGNRFCTDLMPSANYNFTEKLSSQHATALSLAHARHSQGLQVGQPYMQNGVGYAFTSRIWAAALINNYLTVAPSLRNTWASLWVTMTVL